MSTAHLPDDIQQVLDDFDRSDQQAASLVERLDDAQFTWRPDDGRSWSVAQCLEHLTVLNAAYGRAMLAAMEEAGRRGWRRQGPLQPGPIGRWFIRSQEPPVRRKLRTPRKVQPTGGRPRDVILREYREAHDRLRRVAREAAAHDANRATFPNPVAGIIRMKVATGLLALAAHDRRHLWQAERAVGRPDFPAA